MKTLGARIEDYPELASTSAFYESQYYKIEYQDPTALLGYILALEGFAVTQGAWIYSETSGQFGKAACTFLKVHADDDPDHLDKALEHVKPLSETQQRFVAQNLMQSTWVLTHMLEECAVKASRATPKAA